MTCYLIQVFGLVQGVFFRRSAKIQAENLGLKGCAKNLENSSVEIVVCGERKKINDIIRWCYKGSDLARVDKVESKEIEMKIFSNFGII